MGQLNLGDDDRGLANRLLMFGVIIVVVALMAATLNPAFNQVNNSSQQLADSAEANTGLSYMNAIWDWLPPIGLMLGVTMLIAGSLFESRRGL